MSLCVSRNSKQCVIMVCLFWHFNMNHYIIHEFSKKLYHWKEDEVLTILMILRILIIFPLWFVHTKRKAKAMSLKWNQIDYVRTIHTKRKRFHLNGLRSHSSESESDIAFAFARCERSIRSKVQAHITDSNQDSVYLL